MIEDKAERSETTSDPVQAALTHTSNEPVTCNRQNDVRTWLPTYRKLHWVRLHQQVREWDYPATDIERHWVTGSQSISFESCQSNPIDCSLQIEQITRRPIFRCRAGNWIRQLDFVASDSDCRHQLRIQISKWMENKLNLQLKVQPSIQMCWKIELHSHLVNLSIWATPLIQQSISQFD